MQFRPQEPYFIGTFERDFSGGLIDAKPDSVMGGGGQVLHARDIPNMHSPGSQ